MHSDYPDATTAPHSGTCHSETHHAPPPALSHPWSKSPQPGKGDNRLPCPTSSRQARRSAPARPSLALPHRARPQPPNRFTAGARGTSPPATGTSTRALLASRAPIGWRARHVTGQQLHVAVALLGLGEGRHFLSMRSFGGRGKEVGAGLGDSFVEAGGFFPQEGP